ncbi:MAG: TIGR03943 family protein [Caldilineaceae bacterium]|nr:TIGR03943 family protein [Caldilineaceae bacterium]
MSRPRIQLAFKALLIFALALFLYGRIVSGTLYFYINQRFAIFTFGAVVGLLALAASYPILRRKPPTASTHDDTHHEHEADDHASHDLAHDLAHDDAHEHVHEHYRLTWTGAFIVFLPVLLGILVAPQPLGAPALDNRELGADVRSSSMPAAVRQNATKTPGDYNLLDWQNTFLSVEDVRSFDGEPANVTGFVYRDPELGDGLFWLVRFTVSCCVADASPVNLAVRWHGEEIPADNQWVQISGVIDAANLDSRKLPILVAQSVEPVPPPNQPYLYR